MIPCLASLIINDFPLIIQLIHETLPGVTKSPVPLMTQGYVDKTLSGPQLIEKRAHVKGQG